MITLLLALLTAVTLVVAYSLKLWDARLRSRIEAADQRRYQNALAASYKRNETQFHLFKAELAQKIETWDARLTKAEEEAQKARTALAQAIGGRRV